MTQVVTDIGDVFAAESPELPTFDASSEIPISDVNVKGTGPTTLCGMSTNANMYSSKQDMEKAGWVFDWNDAYVFRPSGFCNNVPATSYCGFTSPGAGSISLQLSGSGTATVDYGNPSGQGKVTLYLNDQAIDTAPADTPSKSKEFTFQV